MSPTRNRGRTRARRSIAAASSTGSSRRRGSSVRSVRSTSSRRPSWPRRSPSTCRDDAGAAVRAPAPARGRRARRRVLRRGRNIAAAALRRVRGVEGRRRPPRRERRRDRGSRSTLSRPGSSRRACMSRRSAPGPRPPVRSTTTARLRSMAEGGFPATEAAELVPSCSVRRPPGSAAPISAQWDPWRDDAFRDRLRADATLAKLRRIDEQFFTTIGR